MSGDKDLPASEKKLRRGLEDNQDQPSQELSGLVNALVFGLAFYVAEPWLVSLVLPLMRLEPLAVDRVGLLHERIGATLGELAQAAKIGAVALLAAAALAGLLSNLANRRRPPSLKMPHFSYDPMSQVKQILKPSLLFATVKLWFVCVLVIAIVVYQSWQKLPDVVASIYAEAWATTEFSLSLPVVVLPAVILLLAASAVVDALMKHMDFVKQNRMDHQEIKEEIKEDNGDPMIKSKRLELARGN